MSTFMDTYRRSVYDRPFLMALGASLVFLCIGLAASFYAGIYATDRASNYVADLVLSNVPVFNVESLFIYGTELFVIFLIAVAIWRPRTVPFSAFSLGLFYFIRAGFIILTHIGPFPDRVALDPGSIITRFIGGGDLFFSGHTGAPFLLALIFWQVRPLRHIFLAWSVFFAVVVLLGHLHYSIDVASAYFITYTIFVLSEFLFKKYHMLFYRGLEEESAA